MSSPPTTAAVGETSAEIELPEINAVLVLNSSEGLGDTPGAPDVIVNTGAPAALNPQQVGIRLQPGQYFTFPLLNPANDQQLPLYAIADGPNAQITLELFP